MFTNFYTFYIFLIVKTFYMRLPDCSKIYHITRFMCALYPEKLKPTFLQWFIKRIAVYIWLQLCQILTDFNNFGSAKTGKKCTKQDMHLLTYYLKKVLLMT